MAGKLNLAEHLESGVVDPVRDIETITTEILEAKRDGGEAILRIGRGLIEAKSMLSHGEWLPWLEERVEFSERAAQNFMRLAREYSNPQTLADLGASKALALLALPAEEREEFISAAHVVDGEEKTTAELSARQLAQAIREKEQAQADLREAEEARDKIAQEMAIANARLSGLREDLEQAKAAEAAAAEELAALKARPVEVAVEQVVDEAAIQKARTEAVAEMQAKVDKAQEARRAAEAKRKNAEEALEQVRLQLEAQAKAEKRESLGADKDLALFDVLFAQVQDQINRMQGVLLKVKGKDAQRAAGLSRALLALADKVREVAG